MSRNKDQKTTLSIKTDSSPRGMVRSPDMNFTDHRQHSTELPMSPLTLDGHEEGTKHTPQTATSLSSDAAASPKPATHPRNVTDGATPETSDAHAIKEKLRAYHQKSLEADTPSLLHAYKPIVTDKPHTETTTAMHLAAHYDRTDLIIGLLSHIKEIDDIKTVLNAQDELGRTPLDIAVTSGSIKSVEYLAALGAATTEKTYEQPHLLPKSLIDTPATLQYLAFNGAATLSDIPQFKAHSELLDEKAKATEANFTTALAEFNLGIRADDKTAIGHFNTAIKLAPMYAEAYNQRGKCNGNLSRHDEAIIDFNTSLQIDKQTLNILSVGRDTQHLAPFTAFIKDTINDAQQSINVYDETAKRSPTEFAGKLMKLSEKHAVAKDWQKAVDAMSMAKQLDPALNIKHKTFIYGHFLNKEKEAAATQKPAQHSYVAQISERPTEGRGR